MTRAGARGPGSAGFPRAGASRSARRSGIRLTRRGALAGLAAGLLAGPAGAAALPDWVIVPERSEIAFDYRLDGTPGTGRFRRFSGEGSFDTAAPAAARFTLEIDSASVDFGSRLVNAFATSAEGFDSANHPVIRYGLEALEPVPGEGLFDASGRVTIKGVTRKLVSRVALDITREAAEARGALTVDRRPFGLGVGPIASLIDISPEVTVRFALRARPVV